MKYLFLIPAFYLLSACKSDTNESAGNHDTSHQTGSDEKTASSPMKDMHNAMNRMMDEMHKMQPSGDPDRDFATMMKQHHQGAIDMARAEIAGGTDTSMKRVAQKAIDEQQKEIAEFDNIITGLPASGDSEYGKKAMGMMTPMSDIKMESSSLDAMFASMMIPHHQDAIKMSKEYLKQGKHPRLKQIANSIINSQEQEIKELQNWLNKNGQKS